MGILATANDTGIRAAPSVRCPHPPASASVPKPFPDGTNDGTKRPTVADVLRRYGPSYLAAYEEDLEPHEVKTLRDLMACRTHAMGGHVWKCTWCDHHHYRYHSCRNRHCPTCGGPAKGHWLDRMLGWKLPVPYLHSVFTLPHGPLLALVFLNAKALHNLHFQSAWKALSEEGAQRFGMKLGAVMVLHTWGQRMNGHIHVHVVIPMGGPTADGLRWIGPAELEPLFHADALASKFRMHFLTGLDKLHRCGKLLVPDSANRLLPAADGPLSKIDWVVHCQRPPEHCQAPDAALKYVANYVQGTAISDKRILEDDGRQVTIRVKDYRNDGRRIRVKMTGEEFVRRFVSHILPPWTTRVRYYGYLTNKTRNTDMKQCRKLLGVEEDSEQDLALFDKNNDGTMQGDVDLLEELAQKAIARRADDSTPVVCSKCGCRDLEWLHDILPKAAWRVQLHLKCFPKAARREESAIFRPLCRSP